MLDTKSPTFCEDLKKARIEAGLSGAELSRRVGIYEGLVSRYENPERQDHVKPSALTLSKINRELFGGGITDSVATNATEDDDEDLQAIADALPLEVLIKAIKKFGATVSF